MPSTDAEMAASQDTGTSFNGMDTTGNREGDRTRPRAEKEALEEEKVIIYILMQLNFMNLIGINFVLLLIDLLMKNREKLY